MINPIKMFSARTYAALAFFLFILWFPKDWEDRAQAWAVWARWLSVLNREILLWAFSIVLLGWLVWTDVRPFVRKSFKKKYPPRHAELCSQLADQLSQIRFLAMYIEHDQFDAAASRKAERMIFRADELLSQISYDDETATAVRIYMMHCSRVIRRVLRGLPTEEARVEIDELTGPVFEALHTGKSVNPILLREPQPIPDTEAKTQP